MRLSTATLVAILAATACANSFTVPEISDDLLVTRTDAYEILDILSELQAITNQKRALGEDHEDYLLLEARADSALGNFITALSNSGLIGQVFNTLTTNAALKTELSNLIKSAIQGLIVQGPALISAVWNAGLLQEIFQAFVNDADLRNSFLGVLSSIVQAALGLFTGGGSSTATTATTPQTTGSSKRQFTPEDIERIKRDLPIDFVSEGEYLDKRDLISTLVTVVKTIYDSGLVQSLIQKAFQDPAATISFLTSALKTGVVVIGDIYNWAKSSGILDSILKWLSANGSSILSEVVSFLQALFGGSAAGAAAAAAAPAGTTPYAVGAAATVTTTSTHLTTTLVKRMMY